MIDLPWPWESGGNKGRICRTMPLSRWGNRASWATVSLSTVSSWDLLGQPKVSEPREEKCGSTSSSSAGRHAHFSRQLLVIYHGANPTYKSEEHIYIFQLHCWLQQQSDDSKTAREEKKNVLGKRKGFDYQLRLTSQSYANPLCEVCTSPLSSATTSVPKLRGDCKVNIRILVDNTVYPTASHVWQSPGTAHAFDSAAPLSRNLS